MRNVPALAPRKIEASLFELQEIETHLSLKPGSVELARQDHLQMRHGDERRQVRCLRSWGVTRCHTDGAARPLQMRQAEEESNWQIRKAT